MNWKNFAGGALAGVAITVGTLAWAHSDSSDSRGGHMGMMGMMSQMQGMMSQCSDMMDRMMGEAGSHGMRAGQTTAEDPASGHSSP